MFKSKYLLQDLAKLSRGLVNSSAFSMGLLLLGRGDFSSHSEGTIINFVVVAK